MSEEKKIPLLTADEIINASHGKLERIIIIEGPDGKEYQFKVEFRRLTYDEMINLKGIPKDKPERYVKVVIHTASISPKFETVNQIGKAPTGFISSYAALILDESGKNLFNASKVHSLFEDQDDKDLKKKLLNSSVHKRADS